MTKAYLRGSDPLPSRPRALSSCTARSGDPEGTGSFKKTTGALGCHVCRHPANQRAPETMRKGRGSPGDVPSPAGCDTPSIITISLETLEATRALSSPPQSHDIDIIGQRA